MSSSSDEEELLLLYAVIESRQKEKRIWLDVPVKYRRSIIGINGETVRKLCSTFKVQIVIPPKEEYENTIKITGPQQNLEQVVKEIKTLMENFDNKQALEIQVF
ncbi:K Homology domain,K Homology domain, type 1 [Cinara cedri]|uniref:K Homology domain,K Homology domain, type 1 n=1 Tax=Cinara cedri TaxID=506608 RepID=A0A5E4M4L8_9HEMI|nr:K Homology domain,K Homology domain, type 1 [Cinara cedri]